MFKDKITKALIEAIGADATKKLETVLEAVEAEIEENNKQVIEEHKASLISEGNEKLVEAYEKLETEKKMIREEHEAELDALQQALESKAYDGYKQAADIIEQLNEEIAAIKTEKSESEKIAYDGYEQAAKMIDALKSENESLRQEAVLHMEREFAVAKRKISEAKKEAGNVEDQLFETYERRLYDAKEAMVDLVDQFLKERVTEFDQAVQEELAADEPQSTLAEQLLELAVEHGVKIEGRKDDGQSKRLAAQLEALQTENKSLRQNSIKLESERDRALNEAVSARRVITESTEKSRRSAERAALLRKQECIEGSGLVNEGTATETEKASGESGGSASGISEEIISEPQAQKKLQTESVSSANDWRKLAFNTSSKSAH